VELLAGHVRAQRHVEVVRPQLDARRQRGREHHRAAALEAADLRDGPAVDVARQPIEQRRLVDLQRRDAVVQLVRREEECEVLEAADAGGPARDVAKAQLRRVAEDGRVDQGLADTRPPEPADELLHARGHGGERYCNVLTYAHAWRSPAGRQSASATAYAASPVTAAAYGPTTSFGSPKASAPSPPH